MRKEREMERRKKRVSGECSKLLLCLYVGMSGTDCFRPLDLAGSAHHCMYQILSVCGMHSMHFCQLILLIGQFPTKLLEPLSSRENWRLSLELWVAPITRADICWSAAMAVLLSGTHGQVIIVHLPPPPTNPTHFPPALMRSGTRQHRRRRHYPPSFTQTLFC